MTDDVLEFWFNKENENIWFNPSHIENCFITDKFSHLLEKKTRNNLHP